MILILIVLFFKNYAIYSEFYSEGELVFINSARVETILFLLSVFYPVLFMSNKNINKKIAFIDFILSLIMYVDIIYYRYFNDFPSVLLLSQMKEATQVKDTIIKLIKFEDIFYFIDIPLFMWFLKTDCTAKIKNIKGIIIEIVLIALTTYMAFLFVPNFETRNANRIIVSKIGIYNYHMLDIFYAIKNKILVPKLSKEDKKYVSKVLEDNINIRKNKFTGILKGKNILIIQEESLSNYIIGLKYKDKEITPNLNKLIKESYYNSNFYNEIGGGHSSDAEFLALTGIYPLPYQSINISYPSNKFNTLTKILKDNGYYTFSAHAYRGEFWNRKKMHLNYGFDKSYFKDDYDNSTDISGWGISDEEFFRQTIQKIKNVKQPFFGYLITLENHVPFTINEKDKELNTGKEIENKLLANYLEMMHKVDKSIKVLLDELKKNGLYDNTVIVIYGDHDAEFKKDELKEILDIDEIEIEKVPFIIHVPNNKDINMIDDALASQIDISSTILNLLGINDRLWFSKDIFDKSREKIVILKDNTTITDDYIIKNGIFYSTTTKEKLYINDKINKFINEARIRKKISEFLIKTHR